MTEMVLENFRKFQFHFMIEEIKHRNLPWIELGDGSAAIGMEEGVRENKDNVRNESGVAGDVELTGRWYRR